MNTQKQKDQKTKRYPLVISNFSLIILLMAVTLPACNADKKNFDASGSFEAIETIVSAEANGVIRQFNINEGELLNVGQSVGYIDSTQLFLKKQQLIAQINAVSSRRPNVSTQLAALQTQLHTAQKEKNRLTNLVKGEAAPQKQLDDINAQIELLSKQIAAQKSTLDISTESISKETMPLKVQIDQINDQLAKCRIINPIAGTVLVKYAEEFEMTGAGKPLYQIADLSVLTLRAYVTGNQLPGIKLNQEVQVSTDDGNGGFNQTKGTITWISDKAEFTPKTIQTKEERADKVYAIKVNVPNPHGSFKIGMYGEVKF